MAAQAKKPVVLDFKLGWVPDLPDARDHMYTAPMKILKKIPSKKDLRKKMPPVYDQGSLGSCTACAIGGSFQYLQKKQGMKWFVPSRLFIYYNERVVINTVNEDSGAMIRDGIKSVNKQGVCRETLWPYTISKFTKKPPKKAYKEALKHQVLSYQRIPQTLNQLKGCLADGFPVVYGFTVYDSFMTQEVADSGIMPMPDLATEHVQGGHAVLAVGYDDKKKLFIVRNSWGKSWGSKGYFMMPYEYVLNPSLSDDFWTMRILET